MLNNMKNSDNILDGMEHLNEERYFKILNNKKNWDNWDKREGNISEEHLSEERKDKDILKTVRTGIAEI